MSCDSLDLLIVDVPADTEEVVNIITEIAPDFEPRVFCELKQNKINLVVENEVFLKVRFVCDLRKLMEIIDTVAHKVDGEYVIEKVFEIRGKKYQKVCNISFSYYVEKVVNNNFMCEINCFYV